MYRGHSEKQVGLETKAPALTLCLWENMLLMDLLWKQLLKPCRFLSWELMIQSDHLLICKILGTSLSSGLLSNCCMAYAVIGIAGRNKSSKGACLRSRSVPLVGEGRPAYKATWELLQLLSPKQESCRQQHEGGMWGECVNQENAGLHPQTMFPIHL
jgi:hypothetical protein